MIFGMDNRSSPMISRRDDRTTLAALSEVLGRQNRPVENAMQLAL